MKRGVLGLWPCMAVFLIVSGCGHCTPHFEKGKYAQGQVTVTSFSLHFDQPEIKQTDVRARLEAPWYESLVPEPQDKRGVVFEYVPLRREEFQTAAKAFDRAYEIQKKTGAWRVEPMFEMLSPRDDNARRNQKGDFSDDKHDPEAEDDDRWSLKHIRAEEAWQSIREHCKRGENTAPENCTERQEASGISIAQIDTGYTHHPENWQVINGRPIIDVERGFDYCDNDNNPEDRLIDGLLEFPGHGTGSSSVIVSPEGCQLQGTNIKCINGIARGAQLVPLRAHTSVVVFNPRNLARAIQDIAEGKIKGPPDLVSIAMGGFPSVALEKAVRRAEDNGVLIIAASGNNIGIVVWPARYPSVIAVAATNVRCEPWEYTSLGPAVAISAPGESVWRAQLNEHHEYINSLSDGTTFAVGNTAGAAALWMVRHEEELKNLREQKKQYLITEAFRYALQKSAWKPNVNHNPGGTHCVISPKNSPWDTKKYGAGILDAYGLLEEQLDFKKIGDLRAARQEFEDLPLFSSLYPAEDGKRDKGNKQIERDYQSLFGSPEKREDLNLSKISRFETEIMYHYTMNKELRQNIDALVRADKDITSASLRAQKSLRALPEKDLSKTLRDYLK